MAEPLPTPGQDGWADELNAVLADHEDRLQVLEGRLIGAGAPEGYIAAPVGVRYTDQAATLGAIEWIKAAGTGNTGWQVVWGDTGWFPVEANATVVPTWTSGSISFRRTPGEVHYRFDNVRLQTGSGFAYFFNANRPVPPQYLSTNGRAKGQVGLENNGIVVEHIGIVGGEMFWAGEDASFGNGEFQATRPTVGLLGIVSARCDNPWPTSAPSIG